MGDAISVAMKDEIKRLIEESEMMPSFEIKYNPFSKKYRIWNNLQFGGGGFVCREWELKSEFGSGVYETRFRFFANRALKKCIKHATNDRLKSKYVQLFQ